MTRFVLTPSAAKDLEDIWNYVARDSVRAAGRVIKSVEKAIRKLAKNPGLGHLREDLADSHHKFFLLYSYLMVYRPDTKPLQVLRVIHASRDVQAVLGLHHEGAQTDVSTPS